MRDLKQIQNILVSEIGLDPLQADVFLHYTTYGKGTVSDVASILNKEQKHVRNAVDKLVSLGALIDMPNDIFEAMHPRFTAVNMYKRMCESNNVPFTRNKSVDAIGAALERDYEHARAK